MLKDYGILQGHTDPLTYRSDKASHPLVKTVRITVVDLEIAQASSPCT